MSSERNSPLSEDELAALDHFLLSESCYGAMPIDEAHGYLSALVVSRNRASQNEWLSAIWGSPEFADNNEQARMTDSLLRMRNEIAAVLEAGHPYEPLIIEEEEDGEVVEAYEGWCLGFIHAVADHQESWDRLAKNEQELLTPIAKIALLLNEEEPEMDDEEYEACIELLPGAVAGLYAYWAVH
ncbi:MAG: YecA family protein [Candidatus Polarisedimenticolaceae bacterium]|nr:YecA family protein [Candidatus Polarisedimenticolaceae bacterium]